MLERSRLEVSNNKKKQKRIFPPPSKSECEGETAKSHRVSHIRSLNSCFRTIFWQTGRMQAGFSQDSLFFFFFFVCVKFHGRVILFHSINQLLLLLFQGLISLSLSLSLPSVDPLTSQCESK